MARLAQVEETAPDRERLGRLLAGADHHGQRAGARAADAATHRRVDQGDAALGRPRGQPPRTGGADGAEIDDDVTRLRAIDEAGARTVPEDHGLDHALVGKAEQGCTNLAPERDQVGRASGTSALELDGGVGPTVVDGQAMTGLQDIERHRLAHVAGADEPDVHAAAYAVAAAGLAGRAGQALWYQTDPSFT